MVTMVTTAASAITARCRSRCKGRTAPADSKGSLPGTLAGCGTSRCIFYIEGSSYVANGSITQAARGNAEPHKPGLPQEPALVWQLPSPIQDRNGWQAEAVSGLPAGRHGFDGGKHEQEDTGLHDGGNNPWHAGRLQRDRHRDRFGIWVRHGDGLGLCDGQHKPPPKLRYDAGCVVGRRLIQWRHLWRHVVHRAALLRWLEIAAQTICHGGHRRTSPVPALLCHACPGRSTGSRAGPDRRAGGPAGRRRRLRGRCIRCRRAL
ncbi:hypothetical protein LMG23992_03352 [Cupriavidus laharis]|uniref:Uncharacterized protein n=1 Tax=Cupriavidus laharis TaxID=151654 RepID=A0ABN7YTP4_9BURK|nr:hypothetical protein LMG23992_03352 [Cupriavidus laharis]